MIWQSTRAPWSAGSGGSRARPHTAPAAPAAASRPAESRAAAQLSPSSARRPASARPRAGRSPSAGARRPSGWRSS
eukprot:3932780-Rhodomonas_salina.1